MSTLRFKALAELPFRNYRQDNFVDVPAKLSELFCQNVFSEETMREYLTKEAFNSIIDAIKKGTSMRNELSTLPAALATGFFAILLHNDRQ